MPFSFPRVYPILDSSFFPASGVEAWLSDLGAALADAGATLLEYRDKAGSDAQVLANARLLRESMPAGRVRLVLDDRVDVALAAGFDGVHVDAGDLPAQDARLLMGLDRLVGTSASSEQELLRALSLPVDSISFGPVYPTTTKQTSAAPIGLAGVRRYRSLAGPAATLVAAAGITLETAPLVMEAGADVVAVAAAIFRSGDPAAELKAWIAALG